MKTEFKSWKQSFFTETFNGTTCTHANWEEDGEESDLNQQYVRWKQWRLLNDKQKYMHVLQLKDEG